MVLLVFVWWLQFAAEEARISLPLLRHSGERNQYKSCIWSSQWFFLHVALNEKPILSFSLFPYGIIIPDSALEVRDAGQKSQFIFANHMPVMSGDLMKNTTRCFDNTSLKINPLKACLKPSLKE
jgi:hypothetical protein